MRKITNILLVIVAFLFLGVALFQSLAPPEEEESIDVNTLLSTQEVSVEIQEAPEIDDLPLEDNMDLYQYADPDSVVTMYVTVRSGNPSDNTDHTWRAVNDFTKKLYGEEIQEIPRAEAILQIGDEQGPLPGELGYGEIVPNATIQVRGNTSTQAAQKSYKIELRDRAGEWRGQSTIALNKHPFDETRIRNKLSFDLIKDINHLVSLRTQFVHVYIKDETISPPEEAFVDYGLFTQIEQPNRKFLRNHHLDRDGQLYKAIYFEFFRYPDKIRLADDRLYDPGKFSSILEIKGNQDHSKLIRMLEDVNDHAIPIEVTFEKYFDSENYFTWLAFNILVGNIDTMTQNFYLYSPQNSDTWYFLPWDYDGVLGRQERQLLDRPPYMSWQEGISTYWGVVLHRRVLSVERYRQELDSKIKEMRSYLSPTLINEKIEKYRSVTDKYIFSTPDVLYLPVTNEIYENIIRTLSNEIRINYQLYLESIKKPMPFFLGTPQRKKVDNQLKSDTLIEFTWDEAYDFDAHDITYRFEVSRDWQFQDILVQKNNQFYSIQISMLEPGTHIFGVSSLQTKMAKSNIHSITTWMRRGTSIPA